MVCDRTAWVAALTVFTSLITALAPVSAQVQDRSELIAALDSAAEAHAADSAIAGVAVGVVRAGDTLLLEGYGQANREFDVPTPPDAVYEVGSVTKQFTAAAVLQLAEKDSLDLEADITEYLPDYDTRGHRVTVRHLLHHTSGIINLWNIPQIGNLIAQRVPRDTLYSLAEVEPFRFAPGSAMSYSNTGYSLLGPVIEEASGRSYEEYLEDLLLAPTGMEASHYCDERAVVKQKAQGYSWTEENGFRKALRMNHNWSYAAGALCSTAGDLIRWTQALHGGEVLSDSSYEEMVAPGRLSDGTELRYAMGLRRHQPGGHSTIQHSGGVPGFLSHVRYYPGGDLIVVVLQNSRRSRTPLPLADSLARLVLGEGDKPEESTYEGDLSALTGRYSGPAGGQVLTIEVREKDGTLVAQETGTDEELRLEHHAGQTWTRPTEFITERYRFVQKRGEIVALRVDRYDGHLILRRMDDL